MMQRKHQRQTAQRLLTPGQVRNVLPRLLWRHHGEQDPLRERIQRVHELQLRVAAHGDHLIHFFQPQGDETEPRHETFETELAEVVAALFGGVAGGDGGVEVCGAGVVFVDAAAVFGEDGEVDVEVLGFLFEGGDFGFQGFFGHVGKFVFGVDGKAFCGLIFAEIAACLLSFDQHCCRCMEGLPDGLNAEFAELVVPIL